MAQRYDVERLGEHAQDILNRWCIVAERRLDYLTDLYESGRWRRYHSENALMENLREAKSAVEKWRMLAHREATPDNRAIDWSWLDQPAATLSVVREETGQPSIGSLGTAAVHAALASMVSLQDDAGAAPYAGDFSADDFSAGKDAVRAAECFDDAPETEMIAEMIPDRRTVHERYPMLQHNAL